jgi:hypothetical protein
VITSPFMLDACLTIPCRQRESVSLGFAPHLRSSWFALVKLIVQMQITYLAHVAGTQPPTFV